MPIASKVAISKPVWGKVYSIQLYIISWSVTCYSFLKILWFPPTEHHNMTEITRHMKQHKNKGLRFIFLFERSRIFLFKILNDLQLICTHYCCFPLCHYVHFLYHHDITEILLKVTFNTIYPKPTLPLCS